MFSLKKTLAALSLSLPLCVCAVTGNPASVQSRQNPLMPDSPELRQQREAFGQAKALMRSGQTAKARAIQERALQDYPLNVYLDYWYLNVEPSRAKYPEALAFVRERRHGELADLLRQTYVDFMAARGGFAQVLELLGGKPYENEASLNSREKGLQCRFYEASWHLGRADASAAAFASSLYQSMTGYPDACAGLMTVWRARGYLTDKIKLEKFERAFTGTRYAKQAAALAESLKGSEFAGRVSASMSLYGKPADLFRLTNRTADAHRAAVLAYKRLASLNAEEAVSRLEEFKRRFEPSDTELVEIKRIISLAYLGRMTTAAKVKWVDDNLAAVGWDDELIEARLRRAIWFGQWKNVYALIDYLPESVRAEVNWRYWKGRSARELGEDGTAREILGEVARDRSFFGFLAAQELRQSMPFNQQTLPPQAKWPESVAGNAAIRRFFELNALGDANASVEWREIAKTADDDEALLMADWALKNGRIAYAISGVTLGKRWDALSYRFPIAYLELYQKYSELQKVSLSFLYGISRQESMLNPVIKSPAGAVGLMQLMPATAKLVSRKNHWSYKGVSELVLPETNIRLGSAYIREMLDKFDNNRVLAAVAYNAGPGRVLRWRSSDGLERDAAMYVENIPFLETRKYVQNVLLYDAIYEKLLSGKEKPLLTRAESEYLY